VENYGKAMFHVCSTFERPIKTMKVTYYGHACFSVIIGGKTLLFDPFIKYNELAKHIDIKGIKADYILLSHGHEDHVADAMEIEQNTGATIVSNYEVVTWFKGKGARNAHPMNHGGKWKFDFGTVKFVSAIHSSGLPDGTYGGNPGGFVVESAEGAFYYSGDTALTMDMQLIPMTCSKLNFALLPIGDNFTMGVEDAIIASDFVQCNNIVGLHYDTFGFIKINHAEAVDKFKTKGKTLLLPGIGQTIEL
jgi:L-ascorbate metabolism protein UlaG (beta-lactamase superfamily)